MKNMDRYKPFPVLTIEGSARECGMQHGAGAAERVARTIEIYLSAFESQTQLTLAEVRERARSYAAQIEGLDPDIMAEIRGIAEGARQQIEDVIAVNCRTELLFGSLAGRQPATVVVLPEAARDGRLFIGKNWDWRNPCVDALPDSRRTPPISAWSCRGRSASP